MIKQYEGANFTKLTNEEVERIKTEKRNILDKYNWICGEFSEQLSEATLAQITCFEDIYLLFENKDKYSERKIGETIYRVCVHLGMIKKTDNPKSAEKEFKRWNAEFVADMKKLVELRRLIPKTNKIQKAA